MATDPRDILLLALDVDGVLTDASILLDDNGIETKRFNVRDGLGIATWLRLGLGLALITKRSGDALRHRCRELGIKNIVQGSPDKAAAVRDLSVQTGVELEHMAYVGDDWPDLPAMRLVGLPIAVADAAEEVKSAAALVTSRPGGRGAVREVIDGLLAAKGLMESALEPHQ